MRQKSNGRFCLMLRELRFNLFGCGSRGQARIPRIRASVSDNRCPVCESSDALTRVKLQYPYSLSWVFKYANVQGCLNCGCSFVVKLGLSLARYYTTGYAKFSGRTHATDPQSFFSELAPARALRRSRRHIALIQANVANAERVLNFGAGFGMTLHLLDPKEKYAIELDNTAQTYLLHQNARMVTLDNLPIAYFDVVIASHSFEHLWWSDLNSTLEKLKLSLKPGGYLLCEVPSGDLLQICLPHVRHEPHTMFFTLEGLDVLIRRHGLKRVHLAAVSKDVPVQRRDIWYDSSEKPRPYNSNPGGLTILAKKPEPE